MQKPDWWPRNPYPETIFVMPEEQYPEIVPDPELRTSLSGMLGRRFWEVASEAIWEAMLEAIREGRLVAPVAPDAAAAQFNEVIGMVEDGKPLDYVDDDGTLWVMCGCGHRAGGGVRIGEKRVLCPNCQILARFGLVQIVYPDRLPIETGVKDG